MFFFCIGTNTKKQRRKVKSDTIPHRTQKMHWTKIIGTHNLIFGSTPFGKNNWNQSLPIQEFWTTLLLQTAPGHSDLKDAFSQLMIWDLSTPQVSMGFRSELIAGHFRTLQRFVCNPFWVIFGVCFGSQQDYMLSSLCRRICAVLNWPPPVFAFFCLQLVLWRNCDVEPKRVYWKLNFDILRNSQSSHLAKYS